MTDKEKQDLQYVKKALHGLITWKEMQMGMKMSEHGARHRALSLLRKEYLESNNE